MNQVEMSKVVDLTIEDTNKITVAAREFAESLLQSDEYETSEGIDKTVVKGVEAYIHTFNTLLYQRTKSMDSNVSGTVNSPSY